MRFKDYFEQFDNGYVEPPDYLPPEYLNNPVKRKYVQKTPLDVIPHTDKHLNGFHRTFYNGLVGVLKNGFDRSQMVDQSSIFLCVNLNEQRVPWMIKEYGPYIIKCTVDISNYLIRSDIMKRRRSAGSIAVQLQQIAKNKGVKLSEEIIRKYADQTFYRIDYLKDPNLNFIDGVVIEDTHEGTTIVCRNYNTLQMNAWAYSPTPQYPIKWNPLNQIPEKKPDEPFDKYNKFPSKN